MYGCALKTLEIVILLESMSMVINSVEIVEQLYHKRRIEECNMRAKPQFLQLC
jgi:hypothetical protein